MKLLTAMAIGVAMVGASLLASEVAPNEDNSVKKDDLQIVLRILDPKPQYFVGDKITVETALQNVSQHDIVVCLGVRERKNLVGIGLRMKGPSFFNVTNTTAPHRLK